jgi:hypothetical protein
MTTEEGVCDFLGATSTSVITQIMKELKKKFAVLWGITPRHINIVAAQEMLHIVIPKGIWSNCHAGNVRSRIMGAARGATDTHTDTAEVRLR